MLVCKGFLLVFCSGFLLATAVAQQPELARKAAVASEVSTPADHVLAPNEVVEIKVFQEPDLDTTARLSEKGRIVFPLIGEVEIGGKTAAEAATLIRSRLAQRFLVDPQVTLSIAEEAERYFTVLGQVQRPGTYRFPKRQSLDLIQVIGIASGYTRLADPSRIKVKRRVSGQETVVSVDGKRMAKADSAQGMEIRPGDIITVPERWF